MEVPADLSQLFDAPITRFDGSLLRKLNPRKYPMVSSMIDAMGKLSSEAQHLKRTLTTYEKLLDTDGQFLYLLWEPGPRPNHSSLIGLLKVGYKTLYLYDRSMRPYNAKPLCIMDFFVHTSKQRRGYGHQLYDHMLRQENVPAAAVAIDKPSDSLLSFLSKHYGLTNPVWQTTNFVVYPEFFQILDSDKDSLDGKDHEPPPLNGTASSFSGASPSPSPSAAPEDREGFISRVSTASVSSAQMAKGRKIISMDHQHLW